MIDIRAEYRGDEHGKQWEHGEDALGRLTHVTHVAIGDECQDGHAKQQHLVLTFLLEVAGKSGCGYDEHDDVLHDGHAAAGPVGVFGRSSEGEVALQHVDGVLLEGEDGRIVEHAEQGNEPETAGGKNLAEVLDAERVVLLFCLAGLCVETLVHEEIDDEHDEGNHQQDDTEGDASAYADFAAETCEEGRENHAGGHTEACQCHLRAHSQRHFAALKPLHDTAADGDACHFDAATENHEAHGCDFCARRHSFVERRHTQFVEARDVVQVLGEPCVESAALEGIRHGIPLDDGSHKHHGSAEQGCEAHAHLVEDDACEDEEEDEDVEERLCALHRAEGRCVPSACFLHQVLDGRENVHEDVTAEHRQGEQQKGCPAHGRAVTKCLLNCFCHNSVILIVLCFFSFLLSARTNSRISCKVTIKRAEYKMKAKKLLFLFPSESNFDHGSK